MNSQLIPATLPELERCVQLDPSVPKHRLKVHIEMGDIYLLKRQDEICGYLRLEHFWSKYPFIGWILVCEGHRRQGLGSEMLAQLETRLRQGGHKLLLSSTMLNNQRSQDWHRAQGFRECGALHGVNPGHITEVFYQKSL